jgi:uridine kinase
MKIKFIGITGGTGAGKSTLCTALQNKYPDKIGLIQLDDYFKPAEEKPKVGDIISSDHPESLYIDKLANDLVEFSKGNSVIINTKNEKLNPDYTNTKKRIPVEFHPKPVMLVEGFLVLHDEKVRKMLTTSIWLEIDHETRWSRRVHFKNEEYEKKVLIPMHKLYAEPTKQYAEYIIDVSSLTKEEVLEKVEGIIL